jgi:hypothetical protein
VDPGRLKRLLAAVAGVVAVVAVLFGLLVAINADWGFSGCTGTSVFGWVLPIVAGLLIGGVAWFLLFSAPNYTASGEERRHSVPCPSCTKAVMTGWRMCPYCGRVLPLEPSPGSQQSS